MTKVSTTKGEIDLDQLEIKDIVTWEPNARVIATEWRHNGELVKRDVHAIILSGQALEGDQAEI